MWAPLFPISGADPVTGIELEATNATGAAGVARPVRSVGGVEESIIDQSETDVARHGRRGTSTGQRTTARSMTKEQQSEVQMMRARDLEVRAHEQAHVSVGGNLVKKGASYEYRIGPDGKRYAVSGEVQIDTSEVKDDPQATMLKAQRIRRTALAPAEPSAQDQKVAADAAAMAMSAQQDLARQKYQESQQQTQTQSAKTIEA
jgi:hypothetical protein